MVQYMDQLGGLGWVAMCLGSIHTLSNLDCQLDVHAVVNMVESCNLQVGSSGHWKPASVVTKSCEWGRLRFYSGDCQGC